MVLILFIYWSVIKLWITAGEVITFTGVKPQHFQLDKTETTKLEGIITDWIMQSQSMIQEYTHNYKDNNASIPDAVRNVCLRLTSNMVALAVARRDTPITQVNDWTVTILSSEIFSDDLKKDLEPFIKQAVTGKSDKVFVFTITGEDDTE